MIRISGPQAGPALQALSARPLPDPRRAALRRLIDPADGAPLDQALTLWFPGPASFTGEDAAELHVHGGAAVIAAVCAALGRLPGLRLAAPGEFTRRAFDAGRLDLTAVEGLADLIDAETEGQRRQALRQLEGALARLYDGWRSELISIAALIEAEIDFPDEDLPDALASRAGPQIAALAAAMRAHLADGGRGERVRDGYRIAIIGAPNAGKSSLLNALAGREAAIVSDLPGTTRDVVEVRLMLAGHPVWLADTAGLRAAADAIEAEGVRRALARAEAADLRLGVHDPGAGALDASLAAALLPGDWLVLSKADLAADQASGQAATQDLRTFQLSAKTGAGIAELEAALAGQVAAALAEQEAPALTRARHRAAVVQALAALERAGESLSIAAELAGEDVRLAAQALARLTGRIDVEDVLGEIFARFCIGK